MKTWQFIQHKLAASIPVMLLYVLRSKGSSPGRQGFNMAVAADGDFLGTIGGGIMEHKFVELARAKLTEAVDPLTLYQQVHDKSAAANQSGMICSGEQTIFLYRVKLADLNPIDALVKSLQENRNGTLQLDQYGLSFSENIPHQNFYFQQEGTEHFLYMEKTGYKNILHIIGGGHCALALSKIMQDMDFFIHVYDERPGLNTMEANEFAHLKTTVNAYSDLSSLVIGGDHVYVVIMTFGYRSDDLALRALLHKKFKYIGMLGSRKKIEKMTADYRKGSVDEGILKQLHAPIGIQIKSQTTAEIAISIAAEIIAVKNRDQ